MDYKPVFVCVWLCFAALIHAQSQTDTGRDLRCDVAKAIYDAPDGASVSDFIYDDMTKSKYQSHCTVLPLSWLCPCSSSTNCTCSWVAVNLVLPYFVHYYLLRATSVSLRFITPYLQFNIYWESEWIHVFTSKFRCILYELWYCWLIDAVFYTYTLCLAN